MGQGQSAVNYPFDTWYVAATSDEVSQRLLSRRLLERNVLLYRCRSGEAVALDDRCSHLPLPLSMGRLDDDEVVCPYHGFAFGPDGRCIRVPSQEHVPYDADIRSYPVHEAPPFVWVWLGQPRRARMVPPPRLPWLSEPGWRTFGGRTAVAANYLLLHENALDRTHFAFVHPETSHRGYLTEPPPLRIEVTETSVSYARSFPPAPLAPWQAAATGLSPDVRYVQRESGIFLSPALHVDHMEIDAGDDDGTAFRSTFTRAFTPIDSASTQIFWFSSRNFAIDDDGVAQRLRSIHDRTMDEDRPLLEAIQAAISAGADGRRAVAAADAASVKAQQIVQRMLDEERGHTL